MINKIIIIFIVTFLIGIIVAPFFIKAMKKLKFGQNILEYVDSHKSKQGTPTMGGIIFLFAILITTLFFMDKDCSLSVIALIVMLSYGLLGFLDDFIKIKFKKNEGLKPYQKVIGQVGIAVIIAFFAYTNNYIGSTILLPFTNISINLSWFIIPFIIFVFVAMVNSVNLIDGLDGLCGGVSIAYLLGFASILIILSQHLNGHAINEQINLVYLCFIVCGGLLAFLCFNVFPAKIFMGDTGSLALGGLMASVAVFSRTELYILIIGVAFVITAISDIIQVLYYKKTKKRIFLMAPLHHHFQMKNVNENKITFVYIVITVIVSLLAILLLGVFNGP